MKNESATSGVDVRLFAQSSGQLAGREPLSRFERIARECTGGASELFVDWSANGEMRVDPMGQEQVWLRLHVDAMVPLVCQRCLEIVEMALSVDRFFRFVDDEETAAAQDDDAEEDLLVLSGDFDLRELIDEELVLELPLIARHEVCPAQPMRPALDPDFAVAQEKNARPFAVLARLKAGDQGRTS